MAVTQERFLPECQAWIDHGLAFLTINYHGSTEIGKTFEKSIIERLAELEVQDMVSAYRWLVEGGIAQPDAVFLAGDSMATTDD
jgi:dipeptidyl aminopeptidase/acylaminoacyl peptidase